MRGAGPGPERRQESFKSYFLVDSVGHARAANGMAGQREEGSRRRNEGDVDVEDRSLPAPFHSHPAR